MAQNRVPQALPALFTAADDMIDGLNAHQDEIGIKQNRATALAAILATARTAGGAFATVKAAKPATTTASTVADSNVKAFIGTAADVLRPVLGAKWSPAWAEAGYQNGAIAIPGTVAERQEHVRKLGAYLTAHPAQENTPLQITAARAQTLFGALRDARATVYENIVLSGQKKYERELKIAALRAAMRGLIDELTQLIADNDPRWLAFGLNPPAAPNTPDVPDGLVLRPGPVGSGTLYADWDDMTRADRYRVWKKVVGVDQDFTAVATVTDSDATITSLPIGKNINIRVTAVNDAGETVPSAAVEATLT